MLMPKPWIAVAAGCLAVGAIGGTVFARQTVPAPAPPDTNVSLPASAPAPSSAPVSSSAPEPAPAATPVPSQSQEPAGGDIGVEGAKTFALAHAGVSAQDAAGMKVEQEWENGRMEYEVEFWNGSTEYDYTIDGATGSVLEYKKEERSAPNATGTAYIGETAAGEVALAHAGLTQAAASDYRCWMDYDDGYPHCYRVEFTTGPSLYQYQIGLYDGAVLHHGCSSYGGHHQSSRHGGCHY